MESFIGSRVTHGSAGAPNVTEIHFDCGHHIAEEAPGELAAALADFLSG